METQRLRDRLDGAAALVASALDRRLAGIEEQLPSLATALAADVSDDAVIVRFGPDGVEAWPPQRLLYYPVAPRPNEARADSFAQGEALEFRQHDYARAVDAYREIARSSDSRIRAGALVRVARNLRKLKRFDEALAVYADLGRVGPVAVGGLPADLIAILGRCEAFDGLARSSDLLRESTELTAALDEGRWILDRDAYWALFAERKCGLSAGTEPSLAHARRLALATAVDWLWQQWRENGRGRESWRGRESIETDAGAILVVWRGGADNLTALAAGPGYVETHWSGDWIDQGVDVLLLNGAGRPFVGRPFPTETPIAVPNAAAPRLPWMLNVASRDPAADSAVLANRRRLLVSGLAMMAAVMVLGGYFTWRATARELAVARVQSDFVSAVSHEFRTPLTSMRHLTERLAAGAAISEGRRAQYYSVLARDTERLHRLVENLLDFGRMEAGGREYRFEEIDASALVTRVVREFESQMESGNRRVELVITVAEGQSAAVRADSDALALAIRNLLDNAVKYSPESSTVRVELAREGLRLAIRVHDEGIGIPASEHEKIFEKFVRGAEAKALSVKGTGIGLAMVRHIVSAHGGTIALESEPGRGTTFTILL
jgi:signal transduction histidine kinase